MHGADAGYETKFKAFVPPLHIHTIPVASNNPEHLRGNIVRESCGRR